MNKKLIIKPSLCLMIFAFSLPIFASDLTARMQSFTVLISNAIMHQNGQSLDIFHVQVRIGSGDGWTDLPDIKGNANNSHSVIGESGATSGILRITLPNGQRYVAAFPIEANVVQLTVESDLSAGNAAGPQYELRTPTTVVKLVPVSAIGNSWAAGCGGGVWGIGYFQCQSSGYIFGGTVDGYFLGGLGGTLSSDAETFKQLVEGFGFYFYGGSAYFYGKVTLDDTYHSHIDLGGLAFGGFAAERSDIRWRSPVK